MERDWEACKISNGGKNPRCTEGAKHEPHYIKYRKIRDILRERNMNRDIARDHCTAIKKEAMSTLIKYTKFWFKLSFASMVYNNENMCNNWTIPAK